MNNVPAGVSDRWSPYPFAWKSAQYAAQSDAALAFARQDASNAACAMRGFAPNAQGLCPSSWYQDDAATIGAEIERRAVRARIATARKRAR